MSTGRWRAAAVLPLLALVTAGCGSVSCEGQHPSSSGSCAGVVTLAGVRAHSIPGVPVSVAVAAPGADGLMLAERFWTVPRDDLPAPVRPYVAR